ncbi:MAG: LysR substrate-binding domain-containing protein [Acidimicrobiales bacterium]
MGAARARPGTRGALEAVLVDQGYDAPSSALVLGSTAAVRAAVVSGTSPTVISQRAIEADLAAGSLVQVRVDKLQIHRSLRAVWIKGRPLPPVAVDLLAALPSLPNLQ